jgi:AbrB family looped-hinge helix DNA binding protein
MYQTKITSQGTISIPAALRQKYGFKAGDTITLVDNGKITVEKNQDFASIRTQNAKYLVGTKPLVVKNGDGFALYVTDKYGKK